jgi:hypothetical protein
MTTSTVDSLHPKQVALGQLLLRDLWRGLNIYLEGKILLG